MSKLPSGCFSSRQSLVIRMFLRNSVVMLISLCTIAFSVDICNDFQNEFLAIGPGDNGSLWLFTSETSYGDDWTVYDLPSSALNGDQLNLINRPTLVSNKWPQLAQNLANKQVDNVILSHLQGMGQPTHHRVLVLKVEDDIEQYELYDFDTNKWSKDTVDDGGKWISSDEKDRFYQLLQDGKKIALVKASSNGVFIRTEVLDICTCGFYGVVFQREQNYCQLDYWTVNKGFRHQDQFYLFGKEEVHIFNAIEAFKDNGCSQVKNVTYDEFVQCDGHVTRSHLLSSTRESASNTTSTTSSPQSDSTIPISNYSWHQDVDTSIDHISLMTENSTEYYLPITTLNPIHHIRLYEIIIAGITVAILVVMAVILANMYCRDGTDRSTDKVVRKGSRDRKGHSSGKVKKRSSRRIALPPPPPRVDSNYGKLDPGIVLHLEVGEPSADDMDAPGATQAKPKPQANGPVAGGNVPKPQTAANHLRKHLAHKPTSARMAVKESHSKQAGQHAPKQTNYISANLVKAHK